MRADFPKLLTERERIGHARKFGEVRNLKPTRGMNDEYFAGREGMKARYDSWTNRKQFNENLNPLRGWLRSCVGKNWDKCYGELRTKFDARKVINNHILEHLFWYVEVNAYLNADGKVVVMKTGWHANREVPIAESSYADYYVCPKNGTLKVVKKQTRRQIIKHREAESKRLQDMVYRRIDDRHRLHLVDGIWYVYEINDRPPAVKVLKPPRGWITLNQHLQWAQMADAERQQIGRYVFEHPGVHEIKSPPMDNIHPREGLPPNQYYAKRQQANSKLLSRFRLDGTASPVESTRSHRDLSRYRRAA